MSHALKFNQLGLAIGPGSRELYDEIEQLTLSQISIRHCSWREVPDQEKDILWEDIKKKIPLRNSTKHVYTNSTNLPLTPNPLKDEGPSDYMPESVNCKILGVGREVVGYGIRTPTGTMGVVHGHLLDATEVKVLLMKIVDPMYPVWRKAQGGAETLGGIAKGGYVYWHEDLLAPMDNYDE